MVFGRDGRYRRSQLAGSLAGTLRLARRADVPVGANEGRAAFLALIAAKLVGQPVAMWLHVD